MPRLRTYRVFISHAWDYSEDYRGVVRFLNESPYFYWENLSVPEHDPVPGEDLEYELRNQMRPADVFLIIAGMYVPHRKWIDFELRFARRIGRPILGVIKWGSQRVPTAIQDVATEMVGWHRYSVVSAIRKYALPTGNQ